MQYIVITLTFNHRPITETWVKDELLVAEARWADISSSFFNSSKCGKIIRVSKFSCDMRYSNEQTCTPRMNGSKSEGVR